MRSNSVPFISIFPRVRCSTSETDVSNCRRSNLECTMSDEIQKLNFNDASTWPTNLKQQKKWAHVPLLSRQHRRVQPTTSTAISTANRSSESPEWNHNYRLTWPRPPIEKPRLTQPQSLPSDAKQSPTGACNTSVTILVELQTVKQFDDAAEVCEAPQANLVEANCCVR